MRRLLLGLLAVTTTLIGAPAALAADGDDPAPLRIEVVDQRSHPEVTLTVAVPPELVGKALGDADFSVIEGGVTRTVTAEALPTDDLQVLLMLDTSASMEGDPLVAEKAAAARFLEAIPQGVQVGVVAFDTTPTVVTPFTTDLAAVAADVEGLELGGKTALYDAVVVSAGQFDLGVPGRRAIVLLSDGGDTLSTGTLEEAKTALADAKAAFYAVELASPDNDRAALESLAGAAEGTVVSADDPDALEAIFTELAEQIVNQYALTYTSEASGPTSVVVRAEAFGIVATGERSVQFPVVATPTTAPPATAPPTTAPATTAPPTTVPAPPTTVPAQVETEPDTGTPSTLSLLETRAALYVGLAAVFVAMAALVLFTGIADRQNVRLMAADTRQRFSHTRNKTLASVADQATLFAQRRLEHSGRASGINRLLERAGLAMRPGELVVLAACVAVGTGTIAGILIAPAMGFASAAMVLFLVRFWLSHRAQKRADLFAEQLPDCLQLISGSLRAGFGLMQAIDTVGTEMPSPSGEEFNRVKIETHLGKDTNQALTEMAERVSSDDFGWIVDAIEIHREVGGDLGDIIDSVHDTIRDRNRIRRRVRSMSAEGRISGLILSLLPFGTAAFLLAVNPGYLSELVTTAPGLLLLAGGGVAMVVGILWMRRITDLKY